MRGQLTVRISDGVRDQQVTRFVKGLRFTKTAPGGHHSASVSIDAPEGLFGDLGPADRVFIYDGRNARTVWDGYVENPGRTTVAGGARYELSAMGGVVLSNDQARAVVFIDQGIEGSQWRPTGLGRGAQVGTDRGTLPTDTPTIKLQWPDGTSLPTIAAATMRNTILASTGQPLSMAMGVVVSGKNDADYNNYLHAINAPSTTSSSFTKVDFSTGASAFVTRAGIEFTFTTNPATWFNQFAVVMEREAAFAGTVSGETTWSRWDQIAVVPALRSTSGAYVQNHNPYTRAHMVVAHLVGDGMLMVDPSDAVIESTTTAIDQLAYIEAVKPQQILDDLTLYEPDFLWEILESNATGKHRFAYRAWPTTPRYEVSGRDFTESGGETDLCNRIVVTWNDEAGSPQSTVRTTFVEALGSRVKDAEPVSLPDGQGSLANAQRIGDEVLASLNTPTRSGTAVIRQPIIDRLTGMMVMPWEIEPGYLVRVRDIGVDLRLTEMTYDDADCTASLTLGSPTLSLAQRLARLT